MLEVEDTEGHMENAPLHSNQWSSSAQWHCGADLQICYESLHSLNRLLVEAWTKWVYSGQQNCLGQRSLLIVFQNPSEDVQYHLCARGSLAAWGENLENDHPRWMIVKSPNVGAAACAPLVLCLLDF